jgi:DNA repair exonuclease SbcCD nuclease subunit
MKIVHAADLHIDSPLRGLSRYQGAPVGRLRNATREATERLVELCVREQAKLLLLAGDAFDGKWRDYATGLFWIEQMVRLREAGVQVVSVRGNHDFEFSRALSRPLQLPSNVRELSARKPETIVFDELGVAVHGQSFGARVVDDDLASGYPAPIHGAFNIGLLHTSLDGREGHDPYAPTSLSVLRARGYDYWALGHVHAREVVCQEPHVVYPGNLQGRHARETGAKGAMVLTVEDGALRDLVHEPVDVLRWAVCRVDASAADDVPEVLDRAREAMRAEVAAADGRLLAVRVVIEGECRAHTALSREVAALAEQLRACALDVAPDVLWLEKVQLRTTGHADAARLAERSDAIGQLAEGLMQAGGDEAERAALVAALADLRKKLPVDVTRGEDGVSLEDAFVASLLPEVRELLLSALLEGGAS